MIGVQMDIEEAIAAANAKAAAGMAQALEHAESDAPGWSELAYEFLERYARSNAAFAGWMVVKASQNDRSFPATEAPKAWGPIIKRAVKAGIITHAGTTKDPNRHCNPIPLWRSLVYGQ